MRGAILCCLTFAVFAMAAAKPKSDCEKHREGIEGHETIMKLIPKCKDNGDYEELQCYEDSSFCVCYDKKGHPASPISTKIKHCACHLKRHEKIKLNLENSYIPQCSEDGSFAKRQCWDYNDSCWCVDETGEPRDKTKFTHDKDPCE